jgi:hypothetical protein
LKEVSTLTAAALGQARADGAEKNSPYEYTKAELYYEKSRSDAGRAHFQDAIDWGRRSQDCSERASALSKAEPSTHGNEARPNQTCGEI